MWQPTKILTEWWPNKWGGESYLAPSPYPTLSLEASADSQSHHRKDDEFNTAADSSLGLPLIHANHLQLNIHDTSLHSTFHLPSLPGSTSQLSCLTKPDACRLPPNIDSSNPSYSSPGCTSHLFLYYPQLCHFGQSLDYRHVCRKNKGFFCAVHSIATDPSPSLTTYPPIGCSNLDENGYSRLRKQQTARYTNSLPNSITFTVTSGDSHVLTLEAVRSLKSGNF